MASRRERVILELEDNFTAGMIRAAGAAALLDKNLDSLSGSSVETSRDQAKVAESVKSVGGETEKTSRKTKEYTLAMAIADEKSARLRKDLRDQARAHLDLGKEIDDNNNSLRDGARDIDRYSGRLRLLAEAAVVLGPALVPIGAVAVPATIALAGGLAAAASAAGVAVLAFHGVGDALKALDAYQLDPSAAHLKKMREEFEKIGPTGVQFVKFLDDLEPQLKDLQELSRLGLFPGVEAGISSLLTMMPQLRLIVFDLATELGHLSAEAGNALSGEGAAAFFNYLETDAAPTLEAFAHTLGNVAQGLGSLIVAFAPVSRDFSSGMEAMSKSFANWAAGLSQTQGFRDFVAYVRESGPQVLDLLGSLATAFIDIATAAAPVGAAVLPALTALADILGTIAASPIGPPLFTAAAALIAMNRAAVLANRSMAALSITSGTTATRLASLGVAGAAAALALGSVSDASNQWDSIKRSGDAADATVKSYQDLADVLQNSNIGKYAGDLGIDVQRLAVDLTKNGTSGEYASQVMDQLSESGHGAGAMFKSFAGETLPFYTDGATKAADASHDLSNIIEQSTAVLGRGLPVSAAAATAARRLAIEQNRQAASADEATHSTKGLVAAMHEATDASLKAFDAETQYREALKAAAAQAKKNDAGIRGNSKAVLENRGALSQLAAAWHGQSDAVQKNQGRLHEARQDFYSTAIAMGVAEDKAKALTDRIIGIPTKRVINIEARAERAADVLLQIKRQAEDVAGVYRLNFIVTQTNAFNKRAATPQYASGGYTGPGDKYEPRGIVHADEVVLPKEIVHRDWSMLRARYGHLPGFAGGGLVGSTHVGQSLLPDDNPIRNLSDAAQAAGFSLASLSKVGIKELKQREHSLDAQQRLADKELKAGQDRLNEMRDQLKALKDARQEFADSVKSNFGGNVFGGIDLAQAGQSGLLGSDFQAAVQAYAQQQMDAARAQALANGDKPPEVQSFNMSDWVQQYLDTLSSAQLAQLQATAVTGTLGQQGTQAGSFSYLLGQLRDMGLTGGAYRDLAQSGNRDLANYYASLSPEAIQQLVADYQARNQSLGRLGNRVGDAEFGRQISRQTRAVEKQVDAVHEMRDGVRELARVNKLMDRRLQHLEALAAKAPKDTGTEVGKVINNAVTHGQRRG